MEDAVSPVIGTILLVALTVVLVGIVGAVLMGFGMAEPAPILGIAIGNQGNIITVTHLNGAELPAGSYKILVDGVDKTAAFGGTRDFGPGITLRWDSGTEKVGTVSVVYTSDKGVSTLIAEKRIGKAGSGGGDLSILTVGGKAYTLPLFNGTWNMLKNNVSLSGSSYLIQTNAIYYQDGNYWVAYNPEPLSTENAGDPSFTIEAFNSLYYNAHTPPYDVFVEIVTSRVLTIDNTDLDWGSVRVFKSDVIPVERGALYNDGTSLYLNMNVTGTGAIGGFGGAQYINYNGWRLIGTLTT